MEATWIVYEPSVFGTPIRRRDMEEATLSDATSLVVSVPRAGAKAEQVGGALPRRLRLAGK